MPQLPIKNGLLITPTQMWNGVETEIFFDQIGDEVGRRAGQLLDMRFKLRRLHVRDDEALAFDQLCTLDDEGDQLIVREVQEMLRHAGS